MERKMNDRDSCTPVSNWNNTDVDVTLQRYSTVLNMVNAGNDEQFQEWLRNNKLLVKSVQCKSCSSDMVCITDSRVMDKHNWICLNEVCNNVGMSLSIRHSSFFESFPKTLNLFNIFKLILLWCEHRSINSIDFDTEKQRRLTKQVFLLCDKLADIHIKSTFEGKTVVGGNPSENKLLPVLLDTYPCGYMFGTKIDKTELPTKLYSTQGHNQFLCFADITYSPPLMWVHLLRQGNKIPLLARTLVHPDSIIVTNSRAASAQGLQEAGLRALDVDTLQTLDTPEAHSICNNLGVIWKNVIPVLTEAEHLPMSQARLLLSRFLWHQRFGINAPHCLNNLLLQVAKYFSVSPQQSLDSQDVSTICN